MRIAIFNWRDLEHPKAGGAEIVTDVLVRGLAARGHDVTWFTSRFPGAPVRSRRDGYFVERHGSELTCRFHAFMWLRAQQGAFDVVIDEVNTLPFLSRFATSRPIVLWLHQLAHEVWLVEAPPIVAQIGYALEPTMLALYSGIPVVTGSASSARSFGHIGLHNDVRIICYPLPQAKAPSLAQPVVGRVGYVGRVAPSKRIDHIIRALAIVRGQLPRAHLVVIGSGSERERRRLVGLAHALDIDGAVTFTGRIPAHERDALMCTFDVLALTSLREGWGLVVSEAARYRVPSVVYPVTGLVDSVRDQVTGIVTQAQTPVALAQQLVHLICDRTLRDQLGGEAAAYLESSSESHFVGAFESFLLTTAQGKPAPS